MHSFLHLLHLLAMAATVGTGLALLVINRRVARLDEADRLRFRPHLTATGKIASFGLLLLLVTGLWMTIPLWPVYRDLVLFHIKLALVIVLLVLFGLMQVFQARARRQAGGPAQSWADRFALGVTLLGVLVVTLAVLAFN
jgi:hypothetical protein